MSDDFYLNASDLILLQRFCKKAPRQFNHAAAGVLNEKAFGNQRESTTIIHDKMIVRNPSFVRSSLRVEKARGSMPMEQQESRFGSIRKTRSTGFIEQETGKAMDKTRVASLFARGGVEKGTIKPGLRLKPGTDLLQPWDLVSKANSETHRMIIFLQMMARRPSKKFIMKRPYKGLNKGVYKFERGKIKKVFDTRKKTRVPERVRWLHGGHINYMRSTDMRRVWAREVDKQLRFIKK